MILVPVTRTLPSPTNGAKLSESAKSLLSCARFVRTFRQQKHRAVQSHISGLYCTPARDPRSHGRHLFWRWRRYTRVKSGRSWPLSSMPPTSMVSVPSAARMVSRGCCRRLPFRLRLSQSDGTCCVLRKITSVAQCLTPCSAYNLAGIRRISSPMQGLWPAQTRASSRPSRAHGHHFRPSTNCDRLSEKR